ncbi:MAG: LytTR family transcriptional regulator [Clostridiales bacterium]|nr:LytTR family transcriptional regulator [Clostridiales bacterium]
MKLKTEITNVEDTEIIIRCAQRTERIRQLESMLEAWLQQSSELILTLDDTEYYVPKKDILFFETENGKVMAHTASRVFCTEHKLYELEKLMPPSFIRVSKSCILNADTVSAIHHNIAGASEVVFKRGDKKVYVSRAYYKMLKDKIYEMRFNI